MPCMGPKPFANPCRAHLPCPRLVAREQTSVQAPPAASAVQVVSAVVGFFTRDMPPLTLSAGSKVPIDYWGEHSGETSVLFHKGELLTGCMDKAQYGMYGLVHAVQVSTADCMCGRGSVCHAWSHACFPGKQHLHMLFVA